jgi:hypothetical protein
VRGEQEAGSHGGRQLFCLVSVSCKEPDYPVTWACYACLETEGSRSSSAQEGSA